MGQLQERITSTTAWFGHLRAGDLRARRRLHRPGSRVGVRPPQRHHRAVQGDLRKGDLPGGRPAGLDLDDSQGGHRRRRPLPGRQPGQGDPAALQGAAGHHRDPRHRRALRRGQAASCQRARKIERFLSQPFFVAEQFTGTPGAYVPIAETIRGFEEIIAGKHDDVPERAFFLKGTIEDVVADAENQGTTPHMCGVADRHMCRSGHRRMRRCRQRIGRHNGSHEVSSRSAHPRGGGVQGRDRDALHAHLRRVDRRARKPRAPAGATRTDRAAPVPLGV